ncbi:MAG: hypothetical protein JW712_08575 [Dehalococcoidales bacterium]|nr:hypothetical protein [Dehalococcoidales bacterium]
MARTSMQMTGTMENRKSDDKNRGTRDYPLQYLTHIIPASGKRVPRSIDQPAV